MTQMSGQRLTGAATSAGVPIRVHLLDGSWLERVEYSFTTPMLMDQELEAAERWFRTGRAKFVEVLESPGGQTKDEYWPPTGGV